MPILFVIYTDNLINILNKSAYGCIIGYVDYGCLMYAHSITLISRSVTAMQHMLDICRQFTVDLDVIFNTIKSAAMLTGKGFDTNCAV